MKAMVYVFLADGFEEVEALAPVDIMRRAGVNVKTVGIGGKAVRGARGITVDADAQDCDFDDIEAVVLPGGMPGTKNLEKSPLVRKAVETAYKNGKVVAAICAAPSILGHMGILRGRKAVCYPGYEKDLEGAQVLHTQTCEDGQILTGNGPGAALNFGLLLAGRLSSNADDVKQGMLIL